MPVNFPTQLSTIVKNADTKSRFFGYLSRHGKTIAAGASYTEHGDLLAKWSGRRPKDRMMRDALHADLNSGVLLILQTPRSIDRAAAAAPKAAVINASDAFAVETLDYST